MINLSRSETGPAFEMTTTIGCIAITRKLARMMGGDVTFPKYPLA